MKGNERSRDSRIIGFVGVGLDNQDEHKRITQSEHFILVGGSAETHEKMQDTAIYFGEALKKQGKTLEEAAPEEVLDLLRESMDR